MYLITRIEGVAKVEQVFKNMPRSTARRVSMQALRAGGTIVREAAQTNISTVSKPYTGFLSRRGAVALYNYRKYRGAFRVGVQIRRGYMNTRKLVNGEPVRVGLYASVLEYGKKNQAPRSWIRRAITEKESEARAAILKEVSNRLEQAVKEAGGI